MRRLLAHIFGVHKRGKILFRTPKRRVGGIRNGSRAEYIKLKETTREVVHKKLEHFNAIYGLSWGRVAIRNQRSRWGSCSTKGNLNFNYRLVKLPGSLMDYVIVHELCHIAELNHSRKFWNLVAQTIPDYAKRRRALSEYAKSEYVEN